MTEVFYKFRKDGRLVLLNKKDTKNVLEYIKDKEMGYFAPNVFIDGVFLSFRVNPKINQLTINFWVKGTCISLKQKELTTIYNLMIDENKLLARITSDLV